MPPCFEHIVVKSYLDFSCNWPVRVIFDYYDSSRNGNKVVFMGQ